MSKDSRDRISIDLRNLREKVELLQQSDPKLARMHLSQVLRYLLEIGIKAESGEMRSPEVLRATLLKIRENPSIPDHELTEIAYDADVPVDLLRQIQNCFANQRSQDHVHES